CGVVRNRVFPWSGLLTQKQRGICSSCGSVERPQSHCAPFSRLCRFRHKPELVQGVKGPHLKACCPKCKLPSSWGHPLGACCPKPRGTPLGGLEPLDPLGPV